MKLKKIDTNVDNIDLEDTFFDDIVGIVNIKVLDLEIFSEKIPIENVTKIDTTPDDESTTEIIRRIVSEKDTTSDVESTTKIIRKIVPEKEREEFTSCLKVNEAHKGANLGDGYPIKELRTEGSLCWKMCQENPECEFWTFVSDSYDGQDPEFWKGLCYLKRKQSETPTTIVGFIAGSKNCNPLNQPKKR